MEITLPCLRYTIPDAVLIIHNDAITFYYETPAFEDLESLMRSMSLVNPNLDPLYNSLRNNGFDRLTVKLPATQRDLNLHQMNKTILNATPQLTADASADSLCLYDYTAPGQDPSFHFINEDGSPVAHAAQSRIPALVYDDMLPHEICEILGRQKLHAEQEKLRKIFVEFFLFDRSDTERTSLCKLVQDTIKQFGLRRLDRVIVIDLCNRRGTFLDARFSVNKVFKHDLFDYIPYLTQAIEGFVNQGSVPIEAEKRLEQIEVEAKVTPPFATSFGSAYKELLTAHYIGTVQQKRCEELPTCRIELATYSGIEVVYLPPRSLFKCKMKEESGLTNPTHLHDD